MTIHTPLPPGGGGAGGEGVLETRHLIISGLVQGVGFRYHMVREANRLGLVGWVRNRHDGSVEAMIAGSDEAIAAMIHWSHQGPASARVDRIFVERPDEPPQFEGFQQLPTA